MKNSEVYSPLNTAFKYIGHNLRASNGRGHGTHSPFVFHFITKVLRDRTVYPEYKIAEGLRRKMLADDHEIEIADPGAGSGILASNRRKISSIARTSAKPPRLAQLLFRVARQYKPSTILELGASLGLTTSYLALADPAAKVITMEGAPAVAEIAAANFESIGLKNVNLMQEHFDEGLNKLLSRGLKPDFLFVDGNHRYEPTLNYFRQALVHADDQSIFVFDDIHWSPEMERAWEEIKSQPGVTCTIDIFWMGFVFFRREFHETQHFRIRF